MSSVTPVRSPFPRGVVIAVVVAGVIALGVWGPRSKLGRYVLKVCVIRVVNESGGPVRNIQFAFTRDSYKREECLDLPDAADQQTVQGWIRAAQIEGRTIRYGCKDAVVSEKCWESITAGSLIEIHIEPGGRPRILLTH